MPYRAIKRDDQWCVYKIDDNDQPTGDTLGCHSSESKANAQVRALYVNENLEAVYLADNYVMLKPGDAIRLFPFGKLVKSGKVREITSKLASSFRLPHFKPPIKLGSHNEDTRAGGFIRSLEVRNDGLYGIPEYTEEGAQALERGDYRYYSPEVIWGNSGYENPQTGEIERGPFIVGLALLHSPHLGEAAALYNYEPLDSEVVKMTVETVQVDKTLWESILDRFKGDDEPKEPKEPDKGDVVEIEKFEAMQQERDDLAAKIATLEALEKEKALKGEILSALQVKEKFGAVFADSQDIDKTVDMLAGMGDEQRNWVLTQFAAFVAQIDEGALFSEKGSDGDGASDDPITELNARIESYRKEHKVDYETAFKAITEEEPELANRAY